MDKGSFVLTFFNRATINTLRSIILDTLLRYLILEYK